MQKKRKAHEMESRSTFVYSVRSTRICHLAFTALTSLREQKIARYAKEIVKFSASRSYETNLSKEHLGKTGTHRQIGNGFLDHFASTYASECPTGRDGSDDAIVTILPSNLTKLRVFEEYVDAFESLRKGIKALVATEAPSDPLSFSSFTK